MICGERFSFCAIIRGKIFVSYFIHYEWVVVVNDVIPSNCSRFQQNQGFCSSNMWRHLPAPRNDTLSCPANINTMTNIYIREIPSPHTVDSVGLFLQHLLPFVAFNFGRQTRIYCKWNVPCTHRAGQTKIEWEIRYKTSCDPVGRNMQKFWAVQ